MKRARRNLCLYWTILGLCLFQAPVAPAAEKVSFILNWIPVGYHMGFFLAQDKGDYARAFGGHRGLVANQTITRNEHT